MDTYLDVVRYRELLGNLFRRDLQARYRGSALGVLWTVANPVLLMGVYLLVFGVIWKSPFSKGDHYPLFLLTGLSLWTFFAAALQSSTRSMLDNANLIRKTRFPRQLVPLSVVFAHLVSFVVMLALLLVLNFIALPRVRATEWLAIPLCVLFVGFVCGIALAVASLNVLFRDVEFIVAALLVPWFFLTPILYPLTVHRSTKHPTVVRFIHWANPLSPASRRCARRSSTGTLPFWGDALYLVVACVVALASRRVRLQERRRPDRDRSLSTRRPSYMYGSSPSGRIGGQARDLAFGSSGGRSDGQTSGCGKRGCRPPPGAYVRAGARGGRVDRAADRGDSPRCAAPARARASRRQARRRKTRGSARVARRHVDVLFVRRDCRARRARSGAPRRGRARAGSAPAGSARAARASGAASRPARRCARAACAEPVPDDRVAALVEPVVREEEPVLGAARAPRRRAGVLDLDRHVLRARPPRRARARAAASARRGGRRRSCRASLGA